MATSKRYIGYPCFLVDREYTVFTLYAVWCSNINSSRTVGTIVLANIVRLVSDYILMDRRASFIVS
jgi:hypothetical protein